MLGERVARFGARSRRFLKRTWSYWTLIAIQVGVIYWTFTEFDDVADAASVSVSAGFLLVTLVYVVETRRMASISAEALQLERGRDDRARLEVLRAHLYRARNGVIRVWTYWRHDGAVGSVAEDDPDIPLPSTPEAFQWAIDGNQMITVASTEVQRSMALLYRCGLTHEANRYIEASVRFNATVGMFMAMSMRASRPNDKKEREAWEQENWGQERNAKGLPTWEEAKGGKPEQDLSNAIRALSEGINRYWGVQ